MSPFTVLTVLLPLAAVVMARPETAAGPVPTLTPQELKEAAAELVDGVRTFAEEAKKGMYLDAMIQNAVLLERSAAEIIGRMGYKVSECETKAVIKMAAAGTGSHEVLTVMLAEDELKVLNGRLSLSFGFLKHVAEQLEDELSLSDDVGAYLAAIAFGADATKDILSSADRVVKSKAKAAGHSNDRNRRELSNIELGGGWELTIEGITWNSENGKSRFVLSPIFSGFMITGLTSNFTINF